MANCQTDGARKHPSAMDMYVGALHSKLYSPNRDVESYVYGTKHSAAKKIFDRTSEQISDSIWKESVSQGRASLYGSFREDSLKVAAVSGVDPSYAAMSLQPKSLTSVSGMAGKREVSGDSSQPVHENAGLVVKAVPVVNGTVSHAVAGALPVDFKAGNLDAFKTNNGIERCASFTDRVRDDGRSYNSVELGLNRGPPSGTRLYKSGEQFGSRSAANTSNLQDNTATGQFNVGNVKLDGYGFAEALSAIGGSPTSSKDGRRWPSFGSQGSTDSVGGSPTAKDGARRSSCSNGGSSDGGSPMARDIWRRSSTGSYGSADSSSSIGSTTVKDGSKRVSSSSVLNDKELLPNANLRGMGNIFGGGNIKNSTCKVNSNDSLKSADAPGKRFDNVVQLNKSEGLKVKGCIASSFNGNLGNICSGIANGNVSGGNLANKSSATRASPKPAGEESDWMFDPNDPEDIKRAGNEQYKTGHFMQAVALYDKCIAMRPDHAPYRSNKAAALTGLGNLVEAVQECEDAIKLDPKFYRAHHRAAQLYLRLGLIESARRHFSAAGLQEDARDIQSLQAAEKHISRCIEARKIGDWKSVLKESLAASTAGADSAPQVLGYKSEALLKLHKMDEAEITCTEAERLEKSICKHGLSLSDSFLSILRAHIEMSQGRFDNAITAAQTAARTDPRNSEVVALLRKARAVCRTRTSGNELFNAGKFYEACAAYGEGLESDPTNAVLLCNRAACRSKLGQWEKALEDCDAALNAQPQYIKALMRRANCSLKLERWEDALRDYEVLRVKMPGDMEVSRGLFEAQVAIKKAKGEEIHKMRFGGEVEEVFNAEQLRDSVSFAGLTVVQFCSTWADRCRPICSFFDQLCKRHPCVHFLKVDVDESPDVAKAENVSSVPAFKIFKNGHKVKELVSPSQQDLEFVLRQYG